MTRDAKTGQLRDTGVRFADIAGSPGLVFEMREVVKMLLGDDAYKRVGARPPRVRRCVAVLCVRAGDVPSRRAAPPLTVRRAPAPVDSWLP